MVKEVREKTGATSETEDPFPQEAEEEFFSRGDGLDQGGGHSGGPAMPGLEKLRIL